VLAWTHPASWRQLRSMGQRLYRGATPVEMITIAPLSARLTSHRAVALMSCREDAPALVIGRASGDLLCRTDEHRVAAR
jgi:hypothetical protein